MFAVNIHNTNRFAAIQLSNAEENTLAEVFAFGALLNKFCLNNTNVIDGFTSPQDAVTNIGTGFKSAKLSPFVCRINNGNYIFKEKKYKLNKFYLGSEALHGLLYDATFTIVDSGANDVAAFVKLEYNYNATDKGYPFNYSCTVNYRLEKNVLLTIETIITNNADDAIPVCDGWHPYFNLGEKTNELLLQINSSKMIEFDNRLLPTGNMVPYNKFQQPENIGETHLDNCFLLNENNKAACTLQNEKAGLQLIVNAEKNYPYLQIFTPSHRNSIAIENLSAAPDAFNNKMGLTVLHTQESISFKTSYQLGFTNNLQ